MPRATSICSTPSPGTSLWRSGNASVCTTRFGGASPSATTPQAKPDFGVTGAVAAREYIAGGDAGRTRRARSASTTLERPLPCARSPLARSCTARAGRHDPERQTPGGDCYRGMAVRQDQRPPGHPRMAAVGRHATRGGVGHPGPGPVGLRHLAPAAAGARPGGGRNGRLGMREGDEGSPGAGRPASFFDDVNLRGSLGADNMDGLGLPSGHVAVAFASPPSSTPT